MFAKKPKLLYKMTYQSKICKDWLVKRQNINSIQD